MPTFTDVQSLQKRLEKCIDTAVRNVANQATEQLSHYIKEDFYDKYSPKVYDRTEQFLRSAMSRMLSQGAYEVFLDMSGKYKDITAYEQAKFASQGLHGGYIFRKGYFWDDFEQWCNENILPLLKNELKKQGMKIL